MIHIYDMLIYKNNEEEETLQEKSTITRKRFSKKK